MARISKQCASYEQQCACVELELASVSTHWEPSPRHDVILESLLTLFPPLRRIQPPRHDADDGPVLAGRLAVGDEVGVV